MVATVRAWVEWVDALPSSVAIRESATGYPALLTFHVLSMCVFAGLIMMMDLRLLGLGNRSARFSDIQKNLFPLQMAAMGASAVSGLALVYAQPTRFYWNVYFWMKMSMMALAGVNAIFFHYTTYRSIVRWDSNTVTPPRAKIASVVSLALWAGVIISGRLIAYNWFEIR
jgi:hypothetical protein